MLLATATGDAPSKRLALLDAQGLNGIDKSGASGGNDACDCGRDGESDDSAGHDGRIDAGDVKECDLHSARRSMATGAPMASPTSRLNHCPAHDHGDDAAARCAEGHADADLRRAADDGVRGDAVEADGGEQRASRPKSEVSRAMRRSSMKRSSICCWKVWNFTMVRLGLMLGQRVGDGLFKPGHGMRGLDDHGSGVHGLVFVEVIVGIAGVAGWLCERQKVHGVVLPVDACIGGVSTTPTISCAPSARVVGPNSQSDGRWDCDCRRTASRTPG